LRSEFCNVTVAPRDSDGRSLVTLTTKSGDRFERQSISYDSSSNVEAHHRGTAGSAA
jgi:hypothetical protein